MKKYPKLSSYYHRDLNFLERSIQITNKDLSDPAASGFKNKIFFVSEDKGTKQSQPRPL